MAIRANITRDKCTIPLGIILYVDTLLKNEVYWRGLDWLTSRLRLMAIMYLRTCARMHKDVHEHTIAQKIEKVCDK